MQTSFVGPSAWRRSQLWSLGTRNHWESALKGARGKPSRESWPHEAHWNLLVGKVLWEASLWESGETARKARHALVTATHHRSLLRKNTQQNQDEESFCLQVPPSAPAENALHEARWQGDND